MCEDRAMLQSSGIRWNSGHSAEPRMRHTRWKPLIVPAFRTTTPWLLPPPHKDTFEKANGIGTLGWRMRNALCGPHSRGNINAYSTLSQTLFRSLC